MEKIDLPLNVVVGCLAKHVETNFFSTTLQQYIIKNTVDEEIPGHPMEDRVVEMVFHYFTTTTLLNAQITPFRSYKHQQGKSFKSFMARAERIIVSANFPTLDMNQLSILTHMDMMKNRTLMEEVHKVFDDIF